MALLIDGEPIVYQCSCVNENRIDWGDAGEVTMSHEEVAALADVNAAIRKLTKIAPGDKIIASIV